MTFNGTSTTFDASIHHTGKHTMKFYAHYDRASGYYDYFVSFTDDHGNTVSADRGIAHAVYFGQIA